ncbi:hypothetical protein [Methylomonas sp. AM2-LC]|uniref:c-type cytochrome n=1 Tax=Methylomonas sp. AM2-LC TaxID=3153301 RepID=UPI003263DEB3
MKNYSKISFNFKVMALFCLWVLNTAVFAAAQSGSCPEGISHQHMGHALGNTAGFDLAESKIKTIQNLADSQCSSCHGNQGISVSDTVPNLAGQEPLYLCGWLAGCRNQGNQCEGHEDIAAKFTNQQIIDLSEFYSRLPAKKW